MGVKYQAISWNRQKRIYDWMILLGVTIYLLVFIALNLFLYPDITQETLLIRASATLALFLLHVILSIGPLARIHSAFLPLLYNRRHLGVTMFFIAAVHGALSIIQFHALGNVNPLWSLFFSNTHYNSFTRFPFEILGFFALIILFVMAATSHDFWLHQLGPRFWKSLHMFVYAAYFLIILHVLLGVIQYETSPILVIVLGGGAVTLTSLHLIASLRERKRDTPSQEVNASGFIRVGPVQDIPLNRAKVIATHKERIAVFRYEDKISAVSNVCKHQHGPLGEGRIIDGCVTCPWHGYQYIPHNGSSPPPFQEKVATYDVVIIDEEVWLNPTPYPEGTARPPAIIQSISS